MSAQTFLDGRVTLHLGDVRTVLAGMEENSVDCVVTSPPYWGLRDYGVEGQIGLESTLAEHLSVMVGVFDLVRRVLKPEGTCWVNYGDCYATHPNGRSAADTKAAGKDDRSFRDKPFSTIGGALKAKDLCMVPNRLAIALQEAGWWVRSEIIWAKPNPMPESVYDRPATSHEKVFLLTKSSRYFYDLGAVRQGAGASSERRWQQNIDGQAGSSRAHSGSKPNGNMKAVGGTSARKVRASDVAAPRHIGHVNHTGIEAVPRGSRNLRNYEPAPLSVWPVATRSFREAHFATFPPELAERCVLAGSPKNGLVLDPFGGAGTTGLVAARHGRKAALIELNPEYAAIARRRIEADWKIGDRSASSAFAGPLFSLGAAE
ncbi:DNA-methyltransferase [Aureimonas ureilytica]|uniref:DNA-methyltransferase n=1 Tax=Aureimonas ureilytica TaxID=401562 RepID=UPI0009EC31D4|nr:site-specific DNA-methyltransferase [Aureimonas ureilytica]